MSLRPDIVACWLYRLDPAGRVEILLIRRAADRLYPGMWQCVTGRLERAERIVAAARREVAEETGLGPADLELVHDTGIVSWFHSAPTDALLSEAVFAARVRPAAAVHLSHEHDAHAWLPAAEARRRVAWPAYEQAIDFLEWYVGHPAKTGPFQLP